MNTEIDLGILRLNLKWMSPRDHAKNIKRIAALGFNHPLLFDLFKDIRQEKSIACLVIEDTVNKGSFIGYIVYKYSEKWVYILDMAIVPGLDEFKIKCQIIEKMIARLRQRGRDYIVIDAREKDFILLAILKKCRFRGIRVLRDFFGREDAFRMIFTIREDAVSFEHFEEELNRQIAN